MMYRITSKAKSLMIILLCIASCSRYDFSETFSTLPNWPQAGKTLTVLYNSAQTVLKDEEKITATVRMYGSREFPGASMFSMPNNVIDTEHYPLRKASKGWVLDIHVPDTASGLVATFHHEGKVDNGGGLGYWVPLYSQDGKLLKGAIAGYPAALMRRGWGSDLDKNLHADTLLSFYLQEFAQYPEKKSDFLFSYFSMLKKSKGKESFEEISQTLAALDNKEELSEERLFFLSAWYRSIKDTEKSENYKNRALEQYPIGNWAQREASSKFYKIDAVNEKRDFLNGFLDQYPGATGLDYMYSKVLGQYLQQSDYQSALDYFQELDQKSWSTRPIFSAIHKTVKSGQENVGLVQPIVESILKKARSEIEAPTGRKSALTPSEDWIKKRSLALATALDASASVLKAMGNMTAARNNLEEAYALSDGQDKQINSNYGSLMYEIGNGDSAKTIIENSITDGFETSVMKTVLKEIYIFEHGSVEGYENYFSSIKAKAMDDLKLKILEKMVSESAPSFVLDDTDGETISLADYKGKIVVLDFWATWCGPCKASFPAMKKAMEKYTDVKFFFVNSRETAENKLEAVTDFMTKNSYPFHVLMDDEDTAFESYNIAFLPTKVILDGNQNIRYRSIGYLGEAELLDELDALLSMLNS